MKEFDCLFDEAYCMTKIKVTEMKKDYDWVKGEIIDRHILRHLINTEWNRYGSFELCIFSLTVIA